MEFEYYKGYKIRAGKQILINRDGPVESDWVFDITSENHAPKYDEIIEQLQNINLTLQPKFDLGLDFYIKVGLIETSLKAGLILKIPLEFAYNVIKCTYPYLYGSITPIVDVYITFTGLKILSFDLIDEYTWEQNIFSGTPFNYCWFSPENTDEGDPSLYNSMKETWGFLDFQSVSEISSDSEMKNAFYSVTAKVGKERIGQITTPMYNDYQPSRTNLGKSIIRKTKDDITIQYQVFYFNILNSLVYNNDYDYSNDVIHYTDNSKTFERTLSYSGICENQNSVIFRIFSHQNKQH